MTYLCQPPATASLSMPTSNAWAAFVKVVRNFTDLGGTGNSWWVGGRLTVPGNVATAGEYDKFAVSNGTTE